MISFNIEFEILLIAISLSIIYGLTPITYKLLVLNNNISFESYLLLSTTILFICTLFYSLIFNDHSRVFTEISKINVWILLLFIINVFILTFISQILYHYALKNTSKISIFTIITGFYPLITIILSILVLKEKLSLKMFIGFLIALIGIIVMTY
jgi:drug/metabolite transporter (DMT)-like permease